MEWDLTSVVQQWVDGTANHGVLIRDTEEGTDGEEVRYASKEHADSALHPTLQVDYTDPSLGVDWQASVKVELWDTIEWRLLKDYGEADGSPYDLLALDYYSGPGTYRIRIRPEITTGCSEI